MKKLVGLAAVAVAVSQLLGCSSSKAPTPDAGSPVTVTIHTIAVRGTQSPGPADYLAAQDGTGAWQVVTPTGSDYTFQVKDPSGKFGVVMICPLPASGTREVQEIFSTVTESTDFKLGCAEDSASTSATTVTTEGRGAAVTAQVQVGPHTFSPATDGTATAPVNINVGTYDVFGYTADGSGNLLKGALNHGIIVNGASTAVSVDFSTGFSFTPIALTLTGLESGDTSPSASSAVLSVNEQQFSLGTATGTSPNFTVNTMPESALDPADHHLLTVQADQSDSRVREVLQLVHSPSNTALALPSALTSGMVSNGATDPSVLLNYTWAGGPTQSGLLSAASQTTATYYLFASPAWLAGATQLTMPDLSSVAGWDAAWDLQAGTAITWQLLLIDVAPGWAELLKILPHQLGGYVDGTQLNVAGKSGGFTP